MTHYPSWGMAGPPAIARWALRTYAHPVRVEGVEGVPLDGPVLIVARHYHHLLDGAVAVHHLPRPVHVVVALDWAQRGLQHRVMTLACRLAQWPVIARDGNVSRLRGGLRHAAALLREGRVVLMFPEGYPAIDPAGPPPLRRDDDGFLPFGQGYRTIVRLAGGTACIVPLGLHYARRDGRWEITARFGEPLAAHEPVEDVERAVRVLSR